MQAPQIELVDEDRRLVAGDPERIIAMVDAM